MINCAIYPRKSKVVDNSDSMETQISMCLQYLTTKYGENGFEYTLYDKDYGITGHSVTKRKDFQRMMQDIKDGKINLVVIQRYDRIARNIRDFCNMYHDMENSGCNLVSVSQQIDTTTPYGKNFMYQQAITAELEWELCSQRRKDSIKYANSIGKCTFSNRSVPYGYKAEKIDGIRRMVKDPREEEFVKLIFEDYAKYHNCMRLVKILNDAGESFQPYKVRRIIKSPFYYGEYDGNPNFCEPYVTKEFWDSVQKKSPVIRQDKTKTEEILFTGMIICPSCGRRMRSQGKTKKNGHRFRYYHCEFAHMHRECTFHRVRSELFIEEELIKYIDAFLVKYKVKANSKSVEKKSNKSKIDSIDKEFERLNNMYQKGRITEEKYDTEYLRLQQEKALYEAQNESEDAIINVVNQFDDGWLDIYHKLDRLNQKLFWRGIIDRIIIDENGELKDVIFL